MSSYLKLVRTVATLTAMATLLVACGGILPKKEPMQIITSQVHVDPDPAWQKVNWQLSVARPNGNDMLNSRRMVVSPAAGQLQVYKGVSWDDNVPDIVQDIVVHAFEDSGKMVAVGRQTSGMHADFLLQMDMRDDQAVYRTPAGPPEIEVTISARLIDFSSNRAIASRTFRQTVAASGTGVPAVAHAFDAAWAAMARDLVGWTLTTGQKAYRTDPKQ